MKRSGQKKKKQTLPIASLAKWLACSFFELPCFCGFKGKPRGTPNRSHFVVGGAGFRTNKHTNKQTEKHNNN